MLNLLPFCLLDQLRERCVLSSFNVVYQEWVPISKRRIQENIMPHRESKVIIQYFKPGSQTTRVKQPSASTTITLLYEVFMSHARLTIKTLRPLSLAGELCIGGDGRPNIDSLNKINNEQQVGERSRSSENRTPERLPTRTGLTESLSRVQMENEHLTQQRSSYAELEDSGKALKKNGLPAHSRHQRPALLVSVPLLSGEMSREPGLYSAESERLQHRHSGTDRALRHSFLRRSRICFYIAHGSKYCPGDSARRQHCNAQAYRPSRPLEYGENNLTMTAGCLREHDRTRSILRLRHLQVFYPSPCRQHGVAEERKLKNSHRLLDN
jgi:hypothetical protein